MSQLFATRRFFLAFLIFVGLALGANAQSYKEMMNDPNINYYDVVREAESYFSTRSKGKGSGYTPFLRWKYNNESRYYPTGVRNAVPPSFSDSAWIEFLRTDPQSKYGNSLLGFENGWVEHGPRYVKTITGHYAPGLGRVEDFYVDPNNANRIYLGSRSGGFWRTTNGGATWQNTTDRLPASGVNTIAVLNSNPNEVLINVRNGWNGTTMGIYRSTDGGLTWRVTAFNPTALGKGGLGSNFSINQVAFSPYDDNVVLIAASDGLYRSEDNLTTWQKITNGSIAEIEFHPTNSSIVYIYDYYYWGTNKNLVLRSINGGKSFTPSNTVTGNNDNGNVRLSVSKNCPNCLYFASSNGVWRSTDNGMNFTFIAKPPTGVDGFAVSDANAQYMITGAIDTWASSDGGATFTQKTWWSLGSTKFDGPNYVHADLRKARYIGGAFYIGTDGYLCKSTDNGNTWQRISEGTGIRENYSLAVSQSNTYRNYLGSQDNGQSLMTENGWLEIMGADGMEGIFHSLNDDWLMGSWQYGGRLRYTDGAKTSQQCTPPGQKNASWVAPLFNDPNNPMRVYSMSDSVYLSEDFGLTWKNLGFLNIGVATVSAIAENNTNIIYVSSGSKLAKSTDGGKTFAPISGLPNSSITDIALSPRNDNIVVVTYDRYQRDSSKVFISFNAGATWTNISYNLKDLPVSSVAIDHTPESVIYLGTEHGVVYKRMADMQWTVYNPNLPNVSVQDVKVHYGSNTIRIGTWGRGLWEYPLVGRSAFPSINRVWITNQPTLNSPKRSQQQFVTTNIRYEKSLGRVYVKWSKDAPTFENELAMQKVNDTTYRTNTPLPDFAVGTKMYFKVFAIGANNEITETYKFMYVVQPFEYCSAIGADNTTADYITKVSLAGVENTSGQDKYGNFLNKVITLYTDSTYQLTIGMNFHWDQDTTSAWIDYNHNAEFEPNEMIVMSELNAQHISNGTFRVPSVVVNDTTRLRVRSQYWNEAPNPCGTRTGEVEDYTIVFKTLPKLNYTLSTAQLCSPKNVMFTFMGSGIDSLHWSLENGAWLYQSTKQTEQVLISKVGEYTLKIIGYSSGKPLQLIVPKAITFEAIDTTLVRNANELRSNTADAQYQWLDCSKNYQPISDANQRSYTIQSDGLYAVEITKDDCKDTSVCMMATLVSVNDTPDSSRPTIAPNPTSGIVTVSLQGIAESGSIALYDVRGIKLSTITLSNQQRVTLDMSQYPQGVYYIEVRYGLRQYYFAITKDN